MDFDENAVDMAINEARNGIFDGYLKSVSTSVYGISQVGETITDSVKYQIMRSIGLNPDLFDDSLLMIYLNNFLDNNHLMPSIQIDANLLDKPAFIDFLHRASDQNKLLEVIILDKNFELTPEIYNRISFLNNIVCSFATEELTNNPDAHIQNTYDIFVPDYGNDRDSNPVYCFSIDHELDDIEIQYLVDAANDYNSVNLQTKIDFKVYNPALYKNFLNRLHAAGLNSNTTFTFIGYPLVDSSSVFENIDRDVPNKVNILYSCCHDLIDMYQRPPYLVNSYLYSDLEPGGITSLDSYGSVLQFVENFQDKVKDYDDDLDKTVSAYNYLKDNKSYALDYETQDYGATRDVDKIIDRDKIVCVGFSNLLTIMLRRAGVPCLTYGVDKHQRNIARIKVRDENKNVVQDRICVLDPTWDNNRGFTYFGLSPSDFLYTESPEYISTATSLVLNKDDIDEYRDLSLDIPIIKTGGLYWPYAYSATLLGLCGYDTSMVPTTIDGYADYCATLVENGRIGHIDPKYIVNSFRKVTMMEHPDITDIDERTKTVEDSIAQRENIFDLSPALHLNNYSETYDVVNGTHDSFLMVQVTPTTEMMPQHRNYDILETDSIIEREREYSNENNHEHIPDDVVDDTNTPIITEDTIGTTNNDINTITNETVVEEENLEDYIPGTRIRKPRGRGIYETDEEYVEYLRNYYAIYFPEASNETRETNGTYRLTRNEIIQDLPIYSKEEQVFNTPGMTDAEIEESRAKLR